MHTWFKKTFEIQVKKLEAYGELLLIIYQVKREWQKKYKKTKTMSGIIHH